jgi:hypothetical protein
MNNNRQTVILIAASMPWIALGLAFSVWAGVFVAVAAYLTILEINRTP